MVSKWSVEIALKGAAVKLKENPHETHNDELAENACTHYARSTETKAKRKDKAERLKREAKNRS